MTSSLKVTILNALSDMKARDINDLAVAKLTDVTDHMIIATGTSTTHVKAISRALLKEMRNIDVDPIGIEGEHNAEWVLIDFGSVIVHVMLSSSRTFYNLERLWATFDMDEAISA